MMFKMHFLARIWIKMGQIVKLTGRVFKNSYQFLLFFACWIIAETAADMVLGVEYPHEETGFIENDDGSYEHGADELYANLSKL